jgi:hypothetical protein
VCGAETAGFKTTGFEPQPCQKTAHWLKSGEGDKLVLLLRPHYQHKHEVNRLPKENETMVVSLKLPNPKDSQTMTKTPSDSAPRYPSPQSSASTGPRFFIAPSLMQVLDTTSNDNADHVVCVVPKLRGLKLLALNPNPVKRLLA